MRLSLLFFIYQIGTETAYYKSFLSVIFLCTGVAAAVTNGGRGLSGWELMSGGGGGGGGK